MGVTRDAAAARTLDVLRAIAAYDREHRIPPTLRELKEACGFGSHSSVRTHVGKLAKSGLLEWRPETMRSIRLTGMGRLTARHLEQGRVKK